MNERRAARLDGPSTATGAWLRACELRDALAERVGLAAVLRLEGRVAHGLLLLLAQLRGGLLRGCVLRKGDRGERAEHQNRNETDQLAHSRDTSFHGSVSRRFQRGRPGRIPQLAPTHRRLTNPKGRRLQPR